MLINRNNYETFFLLYADDELRAEERIAVENFISENEDLQGELQLILQAVLPPDDCLFTLKDSLYKNSFIDGSLQEKLLLKIDNELSTKELIELNKSILANTSAIKEERLLSAAKLDATEIIICPQKELLLKTERDTVIVFKKLRWAAAAIFIGLGLFFGWSLYNKKTLPDNEVVVKPNIRPTDNQQENKTAPNKQNIASNLNNNNSKGDNKEAQKTQTSIVAVNKIAQVTDSPVKKTEVINTKELASINEVQKTITPMDNIAAQTIAELQSAAVTKLQKVEIPALTNDNILPLASSYVQTSFTETETGNNKILYMNEEDVKRSKVGTVFKQLKRMIERTAKIKTNNPIRIGGFQIGAD